MPPGWSVSTDLTAVDKIGRNTETEFFGVALRNDADGQMLIAIRGTDTFMEWLVDAEFAPCAFAGSPAAGCVEDGFCSVYKTLRCARSGSDVLSFVRSLPPGTNLRIAGHSLGAAVATLLAVDIAVNLPALDLALYTFASPRVGDYPLYETFGTEIELDSTAYPGIAHRISCYHTLTTYLWMLNHQSPLGLRACARTTQTAQPVSAMDNE
jgi:hypothetical protein